MRWLLGGMLLLLVACTGAPTADDSADTYIEGGCCTYSCEVSPQNVQVQAFDQSDCDEIAQTQCELAGDIVVDATWSPSGC